MSQDRHIDELLFKPLIDRYVDNPRFLRRGWLAAEIDRRVDDVEHPFILMTAEPGFGKSVFMAQLAHDHPEWPRYFIRNNQREPLADVSAHSLLLRIGYQLAARVPELYERSAIEYAVEQRVGEVEDRGEVIGIEVAKLIGSPFHQGVIKVQQHIDTVSGSVVGLRVDELVFEERLMEVADLQHMALIDPARTLQRLRPDERIVILIDALDEVRYHNTQNNLLSWLTNCPKLPGNVCFVLTARPPDGEVQLFTEKQVDRTQRFNLEDRHRDDFRAHLDQDVEAFVTTFVEEVRTSIQPYAHPTEMERFSREAVAKADGNIGYLDALARGIDQALEQDDEHTVRALLALSNLPDDIQKIYAFFLHQIMQRVVNERIEIEDPETWKVHYEAVWPAVHRRMLSVLAVAREPIGLETIQRLGGISVDWIYLAAAVKDLSPFLDMIDSRYRFYHATLPEFLTNDTTKNTRGTQDLYVNASIVNRKIANFYWRTYQDSWEKCDAYGFRNIIAHHKAYLSSIVEYGDRKAQTERLYRMILDSEFRKAQVDKLGDGNSTLNDLLSVLNTALDNDDTIPILKCIGAYRDMFYGTHLPQTVFEAIDERAFITALARLSLYKGVAEWGAVAHLYLAWEAACAGDETSAAKAVKIAQGLQVTYAKGLCRALRIRCALTLSQDAGTATAVNRLNQWGCAEDVRYLLEHLDTTIPSPSESAKLRTRLDTLVNERWYEPTVAEEVTRALVRLATQEEGRALLDQYIGDYLGDKYLPYRDARLEPLGIACVSVADPVWMRKRLRGILSVALISEGMTFTFDLPSLLASDARERGLLCTELQEYLDRGLNETEDRWGSDERAKLGLAGALFRHDQLQKAVDALKQRTRRTNSPNAGYTTLTVLAMIDRFFEMGCSSIAMEHAWPGSYKSLIDLAEWQTTFIFESRLKDERKALVAQYRTWATQPLPETDRIPAILNSLLDYDSRMAYINHIGARWAGTKEGPNSAGLKVLIIYALKDATTLDALIARLIGLNLGRLNDDEFQELCRITEESFSVPLATSKLNIHEISGENSAVEAALWSGR
jgi:hypothetical protein